MKARDGVHGACIQSTPAGPQHLQLTLMLVSMDPDNRPNALLKSRHVTLALWPGRDFVTAGPQKEEAGMDSELASSSAMRHHNTDRMALSLLTGVLTTGWT
jgi:hypothetical protein